MIQRFRKKPVEIEAILYDGLNNGDIEEFIDNGELVLVLPHNEIEIPTLEGTMRASIGDWIIKGIKGEFYPCKPDIFEETYEEII
jgi:hypothetical protein